MFFLIFGNMEKKVTFHEVQHFRQWWLWMLLVALAGLFIYACYYQFVTGEPFGDKPMSDPWLVITTLLTIAVLLLFWFQRLHTRVDAEGVHIRYQPFHRKWKTFAWQDITAAEVKRFNPMMDYGGWGIKNGSYTVQGRMGLLLTFRNRLTVMIGTQKQDALKEAISTFSNATNQKTP